MWTKAFELKSLELLALFCSEPETGGKIFVTVLRNRAYSNVNVL
jgi:hypothetical protein